MSAKHFVNDPNHAVLASLRSLTLTNPSVLLDESNKIIYRHPASLSSSEQKVSVICGGGSGHEPGFAGYVGRGLLTACVAGTIFASPAAQQIRTCLEHRLPPKSKGTLVIVTNYTGDVLNFGMGVEKARAMGKNVEMLVVQDDVGVGRAKGGKVGRRGIAGVALVVKVCGALAEMGVGLEDTARVGKLVADNLVSVGAGLSRVHVPGRPKQDAKDEEQRLGMGMIEIGMGIHNEPGCEQVETDLAGLIKKMLAQMLDPRDKDRAYMQIDKSDETVLLINNFGGLSNMELGDITLEVSEQLMRDYELKPKRVFTGVFFGSLNGLGFGITVLKVVDTGLGSGKTMLELIDMPVEAIGWPGAITRDTWERNFPSERGNFEANDDELKPSNLRVDPILLQQSLTTGLERVIAAEPEITHFDTIVGDGDCGAGIKRGAEAVLKMLKSNKPTEDVLITLSRIVRVVENTMDGTSGALYAIFLNALVHDLQEQDTLSPIAITPRIWSKALALSLQALGRYTPAQPGDRTLMDALFPFVGTLEKTESIKEAAEAARKGAETTKGMRASLGRSVYVGGEGWQDVPDPGAYGLSIFLNGLADDI